jgi:hypothetical protein
LPLGSGYPSIIFNEPGFAAGSGELIYTEGNGGMLPAGGTAGAGTIPGGPYIIDPSSVPPTALPTKFRPYTGR